MLLVPFYFVLRCMGGEIKVHISNFENGIHFKHPLSSLFMFISETEWRAS